MRRQILETVEHLDHLFCERFVARFANECITEKESKRLSPDEAPGVRYRIAEPVELFLPDEVDIREIGNALHLLQHLGLPLLFQLGLQLEVTIEMLFDCPLTFTDHHQDIGNPGIHRLFYDVLNRRGVDDWKHFFRL